MLKGAYYVSCETTYWNYLGFLSAWGDLLSFSVPRGTEKIAGLLFARRGAKSALGYPPSPLKNTNPLFLAKPTLRSANSPRPPFLGNPHYILVYHDPSPKNRIFQSTPKILSFFLLTPSYLLKITKFLFKIS